MENLIDMSVLMSTPPKHDTNEEQGGQGKPIKKKKGKSQKKCKK